MRIALDKIGLVYRPVTAFLFALTACDDRVPPPGSRALETTPPGSPPEPPPPALLSMPQALPCPNGAVVTTDPSACRIALLRDGRLRWQRELPGCGGLLEAAVAMDSVLYARDKATLTSIDPEGEVRWARALVDPPPPTVLAAPTALADSRVAVAATPHRVDVYEQDGNVAWSFAVPSGEILLSPPVGMKTEGLVLTTSVATYYVGTTGEVRWRVEGAG
jgi:outer membrane protein assembly factor BamB